MRHVSASMVGLVVLASGALVALGAGVMLPAIGGFGWWSRPTSAVQAERLPDSGTRAAGAKVPAGSPPAAEPFHTPAAVTPALRIRPIQLSGALAAAAAVPDSADLVLVIENASELRESTVGAAAAQFVLEASGLTPTRLAWTTLAERLGWSESETFDRLLGERVVLVATGFSDPDTARWALLSDISAETDQRLKDRLEASQRAIDQGHQILSIEKGKYELTSHRHTPKANNKSGTPSLDPRITIVLGPAGRSELFDTMVEVLARGADRPLRASPVIEAAAGDAVRAGAGGAGQGIGESEVLMLARLGTREQPPPPANANDRWSDFVILAGGRTRRGAVPLDPSREPSEFSSRIIYRDHRRHAFNTSIAPTSDAVFRSLEPGSLLTIVQAAPVQQILGEAARIIDALRDVPLPAAAQELLAARQVVSIRDAAEPGATTLPPSQLSAVLALETTSPTQIAPLIDSSIVRFISAREQQMGISRPPPRDFGGRLPGITRVLRLDLPESTPLRLFVPDPLTVAWSYPAATTESGWWLLSLTPTPPGLESLPERSHNSVASMLASTPARGEMRRWVWLGSIRPAALERRLPPIVLDIGGFRTAMRRFERARVELSINEAGDIQGDLTVRLAPAE